MISNFKFLGFFSFVYCVRNLYTNAIVWRSRLAQGDMALRSGSMCVLYCFSNIKTMVIGFIISLA